MCVSSRSISGVSRFRRALKDGISDEALVREGFLPANLLWEALCDNARTRIPDAGGHLPCGRPHARAAVIQLGLAAIGHLLAQSAVQVEERSIPSDSIESLG